MFKAKRAYDVQKMEPSPVLQNTIHVLNLNPHKQKKRGESQFQRVIYEQGVTSAISESIVRRKLHNNRRRQQQFQAWLSNHTRLMFE